jgi:DNA modification methylase
MEINKIYTGDNRTILKTFEDKSVNCIVTSPPYYGLRDYGNEAQIGLEETPEAYISTMVDVFTECKRVLKDNGTLWLNIGDSYAANTGYQVEQSIRGGNDFVNAGQNNGKSVKPPKGLKPKDLIGIPWLLAFALRSSGWYLRQDIIWHKPNPMPESVTDRCTKAHEYIFLLSKSAKYYYDAEAIKQESLNPDDDLRRMMQQKEDNKSNPDNLKNGLRIKNEKSQIFGSRSGHSGNHFYDTGKANKRSVWTITTKPFSEAHFATFPEDLIVDCIKAGCPENGIILDPFMGAGTTALVASKLNRNFIGIELNPEYVKIAEKRLQNELGMFNPLVA